MNAPEGFIPYEMETKFGTLALPDRKCAICLARWHFSQCTACCFVESLTESAVPVMNKMNEELNEVKEMTRTIDCPHCGLKFNAESAGTTPYGKGCPRCGWLIKIEEMRE